MLQLARPRKLALCTSFLACRRTRGSERCLVKAASFSDLNLLVFRNTDDGIRGAQAWGQVKDGVNGAAGEMSLLAETVKVAETDGLNRSAAANLLTTQTCKFAHISF
jgi:hypothetical protein